MLPSSQRLSRSQVSELLAKPDIKVVFNRIGTLKFVNSSANSVVTVVTGSKQQKKAVARNKIRRQVYSLFRQYWKTNQQHKRIIAMLYVSKQVYDMSYLELKDLFYALISKIEKTA